MADDLVPESDLPIALRTKGLPPTKITGAASDLVPDHDLPPELRSRGPQNFHYDPVEAERVEPGVTQGLQPSMIQPADIVANVAAFGVPAIGEAMGQTAVREGAGLLGKQALAAGAKAGAAVPLGLAASYYSQGYLDPLTSKIPTDTPIGRLARGVAEQASGMAPFLGGGEIPGTRSAATAERWLRGEQPVAQEATAAAKKQTIENIAQQEKLVGKSVKERAAQKESIAAAAEKTGLANIKQRTEVGEAAAEKTRKANLGERADVYEAVAGKGGQPSAQERLAGTRAEADTKLGEQIVKLQRTAAQELLPEAKQAAIGAAPSPTMAQGPERIARDEEFRQTIKAPLQRWRQGWGARRDELLVPYMNAEPELEPLHAGIAQELAKWPPGRAPYSSRVYSLLQSTSKLGIPEEVTSADIPDVEVQGTNLRDLAKGDPERARRFAERLGLIQPPEPPKPVTVKDLLTRQAEANRIAAASKGADRTAAENVSRAIDETLTSIAPTPELKALNAEYRDHRTQFPHEFEQAISSAARPVDVAPKIFNEPQRALDLAHLGGDSTKTALRTLYAQWVSEKGDKVIDPSHASFLKEIAPNTPYADPKGWVYEKKAEDHLASVINSSPQVRAKWDAAVKQGQQEFLHDYAMQISAFAFKDALRFGPMGERLLTQMRTARTPEAQMKLAGEFYSKLTPEQAALETAKGQPSPEQAAGGAITEAQATQKTPQRAAYEAQIGAPRTARQAKQAFQPKDPSEAAIEAIQERGYKPTPMTGTMKRRMLWTIPGGVGGVLMAGHPSGYVVGAIGMDLAVSAREALVRSFQNSLRDPVNARQFYHAITNPGVPRNFDFLAGEAAKAGVLSSAERAGYDMSIPQHHSEEGPGMKSLRTSQAEHLAPTPSASARAEKVSKQVDKGKQPEVHRDLNRGRLSLDETNKILKVASSNDPAAMANNVPLSELVDALEVASPQEREILLPLVMQRMKQEFSQPKANMTLASNLSKRVRAAQQNNMPVQGAAA